MSVPPKNPCLCGAQTSTEHWEDPATLPTVPQSTTGTRHRLPTDVPILHSMINTLLELQATNSVNTHLAAYFARLQTEQAPPNPITTTTTTGPIVCPHPGHPRPITSGRGAASPGVFQQVLKTSCHGRLGRAHMVDVDALAPAALMELDSLLRRRLRAIFPRGAAYSQPNVDEIFASLAALGLRLEDSACYVDVPILADNTVYNDGTAKRARNCAAWFYANMTLEYAGYWRGSLLETLTELATYRGLFDDEGFLRRE